MNTLSSHFFLMNITGYAIHSWMCANHVIKDLPCPVLKISTLRTWKIRQLNGCSPLSALNQRLQQWKCQSFQFCSENKLRWTVPFSTHIETPTFLKSYHWNIPPSRVICFTAGSKMKGNLNLSFCTFWQSRNNRRCEIKGHVSGERATWSSVTFEQNTFLIRIREWMWKQVWNQKPGKERGSKLQRSDTNT